MGTYISVVAQVKQQDGEYRTLGYKPQWHSYNVFAWIADVRNMGIVPLSKLRGLPQDLKDEIVKQQKEEDDDRRAFPSYGPSTDFHEELLVCLFGNTSYRSISWLSMQELLSVNYDEEVSDARVWDPKYPRDYHSYPKREHEGKSLREFLGQTFMDDLEHLKQLHVDRIVFAFD